MGRKLKAGRILQIAFLLFVFSGFAACTNTHKISIKPELFIKPANIGKETKVNLKVIDGRPEFAIFNRDAAPKLGFSRSLNTVTIVPDSSISDSIYNEVREGLKQLGFRPVRGEKAGRNIVVNVTQMQMFYQRKRVTDIKVKTRIKTTIQMTAQNGSKQYKNIYKSKMDKSSKALGAKFKNEQFVNNGLSLALQQMFEDKKLWFFLSE